MKTNRPCAKNMPIDLSILPSELVEAAVDQRLVLLLGTGISRQAKSGASEILPNWSELVGDLITFAVAEGIDAKGSSAIRQLA